MPAQHHPNGATPVNSLEEYEGRLATIREAVRDWLDANRDDILKVIKEAAKEELNQRDDFGGQQVISGEGEPY
jgi:Arc/MetJ-type ribon-helix-helix transcriptional regulator